MKRTSLVAIAAVLPPCFWPLSGARLSSHETRSSGRGSSPRSWRPTPASSRCSIARDGRSASVGPRDLYNQPVFSPDATRMAVVKPDLEKESQRPVGDRRASGKAIQLTVSKSRENAGSPAWSPDGKQIAYVALRDGYFGLYRKASNGQGQEELLFKNSAPMTLTDWSQDGRYLTYFSTDLTGGGLYAAAARRQPASGSPSRSSAASRRTRDHVCRLTAES